MSMSSTTANWHWKNKNITRWAKEWFERELTTIKIDGDAEGESVVVSNVTEVDGDVELGQRKSKLITIFDCKVALDWQGITSDGTEVKGNVTIPEVSHEITVDNLNEYEYQWTLTTASSTTVDALYTLAKSRLPTALETKFAEFANAIIEVHGKDLTVSTEPSRSATPSLAAPTPAAAASSAAKAPASTKPVKTVDEKKTLNTTRVSVEATFMASADDLFSILTDEKRIPQWTRAPAQSTPVAGSGFSLFSGGVKGTYVSLTPAKEIVQTWALQSPTWPQDHNGTLTITLAQSDDSTKVTFSLEGVPKGLEDEIKRNLEGYYVLGLKSIGYVRLFPSPPSSSSSSSSSLYTTSAKAASSKKQRSSSTKQPNSGQPHYIPVILIAILAFAAAFTIPYLSARSPFPPPSSSFSKSNPLEYD